MAITRIIPTFDDLDFVASWTLNSNLETVYVNESGKRLAADPFIGLLEKDKSTFRNFIQGPISQAGIYLPWITLSNQESRWFKWIVKPRDNHFFLFAINVTDVKAQELYLGQILDSVADMILVKGEKSKIVWANKAFQDHYNLNNEQLKEMIDAEFAVPDYTKQYIVDDKKVWDSGEPLLIDCEPVVRFDGVERKFQTLKTPIFGPNKKVNFTVGISRDITEKMETLEKSMMASRLGAVGEMAGGMAHEINNPVAVIAGKSYILRRLLNNEDNVDKKLILNYLDTIDHHVERVVKVITLLRRLSVNNDLEGFKQVDVRQLINDALILCEAKIKGLGITVTVDIPEGIMVDAKVIQLSQALLYLISNAADAAETSNEKWIKIETKVHKKMLKILISDSGPGVADDILGKIFQPFFTTKEIGKGAGLGLSFSLSVAKNHKGNLRVAKDICPSCFLLEIPLKETI